MASVFQVEHVHAIDSHLMVNVTSALGFISTTRKNAFATSSVASSQRIKNVNAERDALPTFILNRLYTCVTMDKNNLPRLWTKRQIVMEKHCGLDLLPVLYTVLQLQIFGLDAEVPSELRIKEGRALY